MSKDIADELGLPSPAYNLAVGPNPSREQVAIGVERLVPLLAAERVTSVVTIGDSNPALVGAEAAKRLVLPIIHCEAGLRSFDSASVEENNRIQIDRLASLHLCSTAVDRAHIVKERPEARPVITGDLLVDAFHHFGRLRKTIPLLEKRSHERFGLLTIHREENARDLHRLFAVLQNLIATYDGAIVWPVHPKLSGFARHLQTGLEPRLSAKLIITEAATYGELNYIKEHADLVVTDSVGLQVEAYLWRLPCVVIRDKIEHHELERFGATSVVSPDEAGGPKLREAIGKALAVDWASVPSAIFGSPGVAGRMADEIANACTAPVVSEMTAAGSAD